MSLDLKGIRFTYLPGTPVAREVLAGVDLELRRGETLCLMGRTGAGKSTLLQVMCGLLVPGAGEVRLDGNRIQDAGAGNRELRGAVGVLMQSPERQLFASTVGKDVAFGPRNLGVRGDELARRVRGALTAVGLDPEAFGSRSPFSLSEGEMRRAALAGVLAMRPRYLLLDEPSSGLDAAGRSLLRGILADLRKDGAGILVVTHEWEEVEAVADRVAVLSGGRVALCGDKDGILSSPEQLAQAGITPPPLAQVLRGLRLKGMDLPPYAASPREAAALIAGAARGGGR